MTEMTTYERIKRAYEHKPADRIAVIDSPWGATVERWRREGMPAGADWEEFFGMDRVAGFGVDNSPRYESKVIEQTDEYRIHTTNWGATLKDWKHIASTPDFMDFTIVDRDTWAAAKARMTPTGDRVDWNHLRKNHARWRKDGMWIEAGLWFGFDITHSWTVGTERLLMALVEDPEWCIDMFNAELDLDLALLDMVWAEGYTFDSIFWPDDLGYKLNQFMSVGMYRQLLKPVHKRACDWAAAHGVKVHLHSCGDIRPFIPEFIEIGIGCLNPLEVKAGVDPLAVKRQYGDKLCLHGGINAVLWDDIEAIEAQMRSVIPALKENGGYIFSSDHSVPSSVSLENFRRIVQLAKELGTF